MTTSLVTGGAGFLGSHLCKSLLARGHKVICVDNLYTGQKKNIEGLEGDFTFIEHDIIKPFTVKDDVDFIYNLACPASPPHYKAKPLFTLKTCFQGMLNMLELARENSARILQASTSEVYGNPLVHPQHEGYWGNVNSYGPRSCYDEGKRVAEALCYDFSRKFHVDTRIVRIFNSYGPHMHPEDGRVVTNFITHALQGKAMPIMGSGEQTRSFCYVDDTVLGMTLLMNSTVTSPVNIGNPGEYTILQLAEMIQELIPEHGGIEHLQLKEDDVYHKKNDPQKRQPDISKAKELLEWEPQVDLKRGLLQTIPYFKGLLNEKQ